MSGEPNWRDSWRARCDTWADSLASECNFCEGFGVARFNVLGHRIPIRNELSGTTASEPMLRQVLRVHRFSAQFLARVLLKN